MGIQLGNSTGLFGISWGYFPNDLGHLMGCVKKNGKHTPSYGNFFWKMITQAMKCAIFFGGGPILRQIYIDKMAQFLRYPFTGNHHNMNVSINFVLLPCLGFGG